MTSYYSSHKQWKDLKNSLSNFIDYELKHSSMVSMFETIDETERMIMESEFSHLYSRVDKYYDAGIANVIRTVLLETDEVLEKNIHDSVLASIDSKGCELATKAIELLNQVNSGKNVYTSSHITVQEVKSGTNGMNDHGITKTITRPMTADELMKLDYPPLHNVRDNFNEQLTAIKHDPSLLGEELTSQQLDAIQNMTIKDLMGYTGDYGEYIMVLSDRAKFWSIAEPVLDIAISFSAVALAGVTGGLSLGLAAVYFTGKAGWFLANDKNMLTGLPLTKGDKAWLVFDSITSIFAGVAGIKLLAKSSKVPNTVMKAIKVTDKGLSALELSISALTGAYAIGNEQYGSGILLLGVAFIGVKGKIGSNKSKIKVDSRTSIINDFRAGKITLESNKHKGNLGELIMDDHYLKLGYERISLEKVTSLDDKIKKGIDGIYYLADGHPPFIIAEAKYGSSRQIMTRDGLQMSWRWIEAKLEKAVGGDMAKKIILERSLNPNNVGCQLIKVDQFGNITKIPLNILGNIIK